jgi:hypothetical protein
MHENHPLNPLHPRSVPLTFGERARVEITVGLVLANLLLRRAQRCKLHVFQFPIIGIGAAAALFNRCPNLVVGHSLKRRFQLRVKLSRGFEVFKLRTSSRTAQWRFTLSWRGEIISGIEMAESV